MRRYDLDWLRVIVFGLLIFYHVGMFFVPWGWHIKNNEIYDWLRWPMLWLNQWRLPILFVISGMGTWYALGKRSAGQFAWERVRRLLVPLLFGMLVVVPPQIYFERLDQGQFTGGYFAYWPSQAFVGVYPEGNLSWHHLWFLPYLLIYSLVLIPVFLYFRRHTASVVTGWLRRRVPSPVGVMVFLIPLYLVESLVEPFFDVTHGLVDDWFTFTNFLLLFAFGFLLMTVQDVFWPMVQRYRRHFLVCGLVGFTAMVGLRQLYEDSVIIHFIEAALKVFNFWAWILTLFGHAATWLNRPSRAVAYANEAVYPFYILHQSVTIGIGYYVMDLPWGLLPKALVMVVGTFGICWVLYEGLIRRVGVLRPLFGLKGVAKDK